MLYCANHPEEISKLAKVKAQVSEVKGVMMENIEKVRNFGCNHLFFFIIYKAVNMAIKVVDVPFL